MKKFIENLKSYLQNVLNTSVNVHPWKDKSSFPIFLIDSYDFYNLSIFDLSCLLIIPKGTIELTPGVISNYYKQAQKYCDGFVIHAQTCLSSYNRKRLIDHCIPFVIPGNQMYLPHLGIDLREHFRKSLSKPSNAYLCFPLHALRLGFMTFCKLIICIRQTGFMSILKGV